MGFWGVRGVFDGEAVCFEFGFIVGLSPKLSLNWIGDVGCGKCIFLFFGGCGEGYTARVLWRGWMGCAGGLFGWGVWVVGFVRVVRGRCWGWWSSAAADHVCFGCKFVSGR